MTQAPKGSETLFEIRLRVIEGRTSVARDQWKRQNLRVGKVFELNRSRYTVLLRINAPLKV